MEKFYKIVGYVGGKNELFLEYKRKMNDFLLEKETQIFVINQELQKEFDFCFLMFHYYYSHSQECFNSYSMPVREIVSLNEITNDTLQEFIENMNV